MPAMDEFGNIYSRDEMLNGARVRVPVMTPVQSFGHSLKNIFRRLSGQKEGLFKVNLKKAPGVNAENTIDGP